MGRKKININLFILRISMTEDHDGFVWRLAKEGERRESAWKKNLRNLEEKKNKHSWLQKTPNAGEKTHSREGKRSAGKESEGKESEGKESGGKESEEKGKRGKRGVRASEIRSTTRRKGWANSMWWETDGG